MSVEIENLFIHLGKKGFSRVSKSNLPVLSTSLHYGDAVFEGMSIFEKQGRFGLFHPSLNLERMRYNANELLFGFPKVTDAELISVIFRLIILNGWGDGLPECTGIEKAGKKVKRAYVRNLLFSDNNGIGVGTPLKPEMLTVLAPIGKYFDSGEEEVNLMLFPGPRTVAFPCLKGSGNYQLGMYSKRMLKKFNELGGIQCYETLFLNGRGNVAEGSAENVVILKNGEFITPHPKEGVLMGISLRIISDIAKKMGMGFSFGSISLKDVADAEGMFMCGNAAGIVPVDRIVDVGPDYKVRGILELPTCQSDEIRRIRRKYEETEIWKGKTAFHTFLDEWFPDGKNPQKPPEKFAKDAECLREKFSIYKYID